MAVSVSFATTLDTPEHVRIAEDLGFHRAWLYDTPQQSPDVWMMLAAAAGRTTRIGLGPGVLVPTLRHPMVNATATAALESMAPGRVAVAFGTGYTGCKAMGQPPVSWSYLSAYVTTYRALLRGESVEWEGGWLKMLHPPENLPRTALASIPVYIAAIGPKGTRIAQTLGDGLFAVQDAPPAATNFPHVIFGTTGTVVDDGESMTSDRVRAAAGPGVVQAYHATYELIGEAAVHGVPGGPEWLAEINQAPEHLRHLTIHNGHLMTMNAADDIGWNAGGSALLTHTTMTGTATEVRRRADELADRGVNELSFQPMGDIRRELEAFAEALKL
ncbi:LLM class flavin-dependent oxidoreductase [Nocardia sp. NBC_00881]|uniref:LLM class flavin-dependent oxidoreductase n=1 Tax=Nocardia sp. NBC_00881 TaxID=2975995 RepID=UPI00386D9BAE|nr:LLM class flavin-dependent oxidoreductase [Nocardia sp. NBC_00881]